MGPASTPERGDLAVGAGRFAIAATLPGAVRNRSDPGQDPKGSSESATTHMEKYCAEAPYAWASATLAPSTWCSPAMPRTWSAASLKRSRPEAPIGFDDSTPPDMFTGNEPVNAVSPRSTIFQPSAGPAMSCASSHIGSYQLNGT